MNTSATQNASQTNYDAFAAFYDTWHDRWPENAKANCVETLSRLANGTDVLELAIGTGRIALPLSMRGLKVSGVDNSVRMLDKLREKPGAEQLSLVCGNFADIPVQGQFGLIYIVVSFGYLLNQKEQLRCLENVRAKLAPGGAFVIQTVVPGPEIFNGTGTLDDLFDVPSTAGGETDAVMLLCSKTDLVRQVIDQRVIVLGDDAPKIYTHQRRYVWPSELDMMARAAGLELESRWGSWTQEPFTQKSRSQISVYRRHRDAASERKGLE
ncbi:class I SAM-dependent methyltransferase [Trinickia caryophylli]|uniref:Methyltransferase domain-containing protein n=1 Tax=Trinickia caryophylli TaxID=28094 RepID=A0A1X7H4Q2_TRICW|nr:class I SAM-dependent methyltransferase [Trinickia caryophylli]PMS09600.1 class I SAM-dependent methyltransferase [Trinickia caryophylli]TRX17266.1 class I SAM-dependent methyltransferase [Trinickia caryophylli]WQE11996.1 class I SAM-dependent methyltransferase [Trinickia caryophylli]SMF79724.1 Methyltransferase domain-containing protein [Trinickia caryophylli]GLU35611.1 methyltransferase [Trinickia caryophylli]